MLKKLGIGVVVLFLLFILFLYFGVGPAIEKVKPKLLEVASATLKTPVAADTIDVSILPSPSFLLENISIGEEKLKVGSASLSVAILPALSGTVNITEVSLSDTVLTAVMKKDGTVAIDGLDGLMNPPKDAKAEQQNNAQENNSSKETSTPEGSSDLQLDVEEAKITNIVVNLKKNEKSEKIVVDSIRLARKSESQSSLAAQVSLFGGEIRVDGNLGEIILSQMPPALDADVKISFPDLSRPASFFEAPPTVKGSLDGKLNLSMKSKEDISVSGLDINVLLPGIDASLRGKVTDAIAQLYAMTFTLNSINLPEVLDNFAPDYKGQYQGTLTDISCSLSATTSKQHTVDCTSPSSSVNTVPIEVQAIKILANMTDEKSPKITVRPAKIKIGSGEVDLDVDMNGQSSKNVESKLLQLSIAELLKLAPEGPRSLPISGTITDINARLSIPETGPSGPFSAKIAPLEIAGFNLFAEVLSAVKAIPGVDMGLDAAGGGDLNASDTRFSTITADGAMKGQVINLQSFKAQSGSYHISGDGVMSPDGMTLNVSFVLEPSFVSQLETRSKKIEKIKNPDGTLVLPIVIKKSGDSKPIIIPDAKKILKMQAGVQARNAAKKALDKVTPGLGGVVDGLLN